MRIGQLKSRLYFITDEQSSHGRSVEETVRLAIEGGVGLVQYREKSKTIRQMVDEAGDLMRLARKARVPFIVNDRVDVALAATADGVHLGSDDMPAAVARRLMGPRAIVGVTVSSAADALEAQRQGASYVAIGPIFPSATKPDVCAVGVEAIAQIAAAVKLPVCAIGGITAQNIGQLRDTATALVAVVSAITAAQDPRAAARALLQAMESHAKTDG